MFGLVPSGRRGSNIQRRNDVWDLRSVFEDFLNDSFFLPGFPSTVHPIRADIRETDKEYIIDAEIPGVNKEDIKVDLRDDTLTISVENRSETKEERENFIRRERRYGSYSRSFYLDNVSHDDIKAKYDNGVLRITLPKLQETKCKSRCINIE